MDRSIMQTAAGIQFSAPDLRAELDRISHDLTRFDELSFGLIVMDHDATVLAYNRVESEFSGIKQQRILGLNFFTDVAPCTNNYLVSGRFESESTLDETIDYVFTLKMQPTKVALRMLRDERSPLQYLAVRRR